MLVCIKAPNIGGSIEGVDAPESAILAKLVYNDSESNLKEQLE
jgi:hypothetical protein